MNKSCSIRCDVVGCMHNCNGVNCKLDCIKVTCGSGTSCTCCDSYAEKL